MEARPVERRVYRLVRGLISWGSASMAFPAVSSIRDVPESFYYRGPRCFRLLPKWRLIHFGFLRDLVCQTAYFRWRRYCSLKQRRAASEQHNRRLFERRVFHLCIDHRLISKQTLGNVLDVFEFQHVLSSRRHPMSIGSSFRTYQ